MGVYFIGWVMIDELLSPLLTTTWGRRAGLGVTIVMALFVFITFVGMIFSWKNDIQLTQTEPLHENRMEAGDQLSKLIAQIPERHLFGKYGVLESAFLPVTSLQIHLIGVIKATPEKFSRVIISESNQPGKIYQVGDRLPSSGVKIYAITQDGVILDNAGQYEKLPLSRTQLEFQGMPKPLTGE